MKAAPGITDVAYHNDFDYNENSEGLVQDSSISRSLAMYEFSPWYMNTPCPGCIETEQLIWV